MNAAGRELVAAMSELQDISVLARRLSASVEQTVGGSATGLDGKLVEALSTLSRSTSRAAHAIASMPRGD